MVKLVASGKDGRTVVFLGISEGNVRKLRERQPIHVHGEELGARFAGIDFVISYGETEEVIVDELRPLLGDRQPDQGPRRQ